MKPWKIGVHTAYNGLVNVLSKSTTKWWEIDNKKSKGAIKKLIKGKMQIGNHHTKGSPILLVGRKTQKRKSRYRLIAIRLVKNLFNVFIQWWQMCMYFVLLLIVWVITTVSEINWKIFSKLKMYIPFHSIIWIWGRYPKEVRAWIYMHACTCTIIQHLVAKLWGKNWILINRALNNL